MDASSQAPEAARPADSTEPDDLAGKAHEIVAGPRGYSVDQAARIVERAFPMPEESNGIEHLDGTPELLDVLDELPTTHPSRAGIRFLVERVEADQTARQVPMSWDPALPTYERLGKLVAGGVLNPGTYRVKMRRGRSTAKLISMSIAEPIALGAAHGSGGMEGQLLPLFERLIGTLAGGPSSRGIPSELTEAVTLSRVGQEEVSGRLDQLEVQLGELQETISGAVGALLAQGQGGGGDIGALLGDVLSRFGGAPAPAQAPASGGNGQVAGGRLGDLTA